MKITILDTPPELHKILLKKDKILDRAIKNSLLLDEDQHVIQFKIPYKGEFVAYSPAHLLDLTGVSYLLYNRIIDYRIDSTWIIVSSEVFHSQIPGTK